jgi:hypothetical protein
MDVEMPEYTTPLYTCTWDGCSVKHPKMDKKRKCICPALHIGKTEMDIYVDFEVAQQKGCV